MTDDSKKTSWLSKAESLLQERFGHHTFRGAQREVMAALEAGRNALVLMPTGFGKSLCYQLPSQLLEGLTLVVSPLIALMEDQVQAARKKGLRCGAIHSGQSSQERELAYKAIGNGQWKLIYCTPERFRKAEFMAALGRQKISLLAVDEAHCLSQWGHDFRPEYSRLGEIRATLIERGSQEMVTMALTATATPEVQKDILTQLALEPQAVAYFREGIERPNLSLEVQDLYGFEAKVEQAVKARQEQPGAAIFYFSLISSLERFSSEFQRRGLEHLTYHGQMGDRDRRRTQKIFTEGQTPLILATPAFGLGVDKANVRLVVHGELPGSIEAYYQEVGRAGRDGRPARCLLLFDADDISIQMDFIKWANPEPQFIRQVYQLIERQPDRLMAEGLDFIRAELNFYNRRDFRLETAMNLLKRWDCVVEENVGRKLRWTAQGEPPEEYLDPEAFKLRLKRQNEKLLEMVRLAQMAAGHKERIYQYFGVDV